jgi:hypothetical protein
MTRFTLAIAATLALAVTLPAVPANAQGAIRTYVSITGNDSNPCSLTAPCRHFQAAANATAAGGEVDALDPGGYGSLTINQAITIDGEGWSYVAPANNGNGITINAGSGNVTLRGLSLNGVGTTATNGIVFTTGDSLTVTNCVLQNFGWNGSNATTGNGILMEPTSDQVTFAITNAIVSNNGLNGFAYFPPNGATNGYGVIDHVVATNNNFDGFYIDIGNGSVTVAISNSIASNNNAGIYIENQNSVPVTVSIDNTGASNNVYGIYAENTPTVFLGRSVITGNTMVGVGNDTSPSTFYSYQDNRVSGNGTGPSANVPVAMSPNTLY